VEPEALVERVVLALKELQVSLAHKEPQEQLARMVLLVRLVQLVKQAQPEELVVPVELVELVLRAVKV